MAIAFICDEKERNAVAGAEEGSCSKLILFRARRYVGSQESNSGCVVLDSDAVSA
jgi:hypothetical protein